jgi:alginate O-acetyltransferase complex protein AlgJ
MRLRGLQGTGHSNGAGELAEHEFAPARLVQDDKVIRGKEGWLFLAGDRNDVLAQHTGELLLKPDQLEHWRVVLERRKRALAELGAEYLFAIAPDNHAVYPEFLPDGVDHVEHRPVSQLCDHLEGRDSPVEPIYPLAELLEAKRERVVCMSSDTHWNEYGAFVVYSRLADQIERTVPMRRVSEEEVVFPEVNTVGDLGHKLRPGFAEPSTVAFMRHVSAALVADNRVEGVGAVIETECPDATGSCVLVGDSYAWSLMRFFAESFRHFTFVHMATVDLDFVARRRPDVVVNMTAERFLIAVPEDDGAPTAKEHAKQKIATGRTRDAVPFWQLTTRPSPETAERMRSALLAEGRIRDATIVSLLAHAGLKPPEIVALRWRHVHDTHLEIRRPRRRPGRLERIPLLGRLSERHRTRRTHDREVPVLAHLAEDLDRWWHCCDGSTGDSEFVFPGIEGDHWKRGEWRTWRDSVYVPLAKAAGAGDCSPHDLRHVVSKLLINAGASPAEVAGVLGTTLEQVQSDYAEVWFYTSAMPPLPVDVQVKRMRARARALPR